MSAATHGQEGSTNRLWVERIATWLGIDRVTDSPRLSPYLFILGVYLLDIPVLSTIGYLTNPTHPLVFTNNPVGSLGLPIGLVFGVWATRRLRRAYGRAVDGLTGPSSLPDQYRRRLSPIGTAITGFGTTRDPDEPTAAYVEELVSDRFKLLILVGMWLLYGAHLYLNPTSPEAVYDVAGPVIATIKVWAIIPLGYFVLAVDFIGTYAGVILLLPLKIREIGLMDFRDPLGYGQLKPVGDLIRSATIFYFIGLSVYAIWITSGELLGATAAVSVSTVITTVIVGGSVLGVVLFFLPIISLHGYMKSAKHEKIQEIAAEIRESGPTDDPEIFPETKLPEDADQGIEYTQLFIDMTVVENTREYPIDVSHLQEILLAAVIPYIAHITTTVIIELLPGGH